MNSIMGGTLTQMGYEISVGNIQNNLDDEGHGIARNYQTWQNWNWERGGEEWTVSPEWKRSLIKEIMLKYIEPEKSVLEIGPGAGRWTESLQKIAMSLILVDLSDKCIDFCKQRFHHCDNIQYFVNNGASLDFIQDETVDFIWSFDVFVHINPSDTEKYIKEFSRILVSGGRGIIHHPAEGGQHGGARSKITAELFSDMLKRYGLALVAQFDSWGEKGEFDVRFHHDTVTVFEKAKLRKSASSVDTKKQISFLRISDETSRVAISKEYANALKRWQACKPNEGLTWGVKITGDAFIGLAQKRNIFSPYRSVLELGPGYGRLLSSILSMNIPFKSYTGIDISENNIQYLQGNFKQNNIDFVQGNFNAVKLNGKYDIVLSSLTLKHQYPSFLDALRNIDQYVSNDGVYFFDLLENRNMYDGNEDLTKSPSKIAWEKDGVYIALYTQKEVLRILDSISLQIIAFDHVTHVKERGDRLVVIAGRKYSIKK
jgi:ubiquinone/menaquinone biosynthesis C-methylase UbiE